MLFLKQIAKKYTIVITESLPLGIYKLYSIDKIKVGDIVQFTPTKEEMEVIYTRHYLPRYAETLLKIVAADYYNKDEIKIINDILYVGEKTME